MCPIQRSTLMRWNPTFIDLFVQLVLGMTPGLMACEGYAVSLINDRYIRFGAFIVMIVLTFYD